MLSSVTRFLVLMSLVACGRLPALAPGEAGQDAIRGAGLDLSGPSSAMFGDCPNFSQVANGDVMAVVSREFGRLSSLGGLIAWHAPNLAENRLRLLTVGLHDGTRHRWAESWKLVGQRVLPDTGIVETRLQHPELPLALELSDVAHRRLPGVVRRVRLIHAGNRPLGGLRLTVFGHVTLDRTGKGDALLVDTDRRRLVQTNPAEEVAAVIGVDQPVTGWQAGRSLLRVGSGEDAWFDADDGRLKGATRVAGVGANGALQVQVPVLEAGARWDLQVAMATAPDAPRSQAVVDRLLQEGHAALMAADAAWWKNWLDQSVLPAGLDPREAAVVRRALVVLHQLQSSTGGVLASPSALSPAYKYVWLQDAAFDARALMVSGHREQAAAILRFLARVQKPDGDWWVTYFSDGRPNPLWEHGTEFMGAHFVTTAGAYLATYGVDETVRAIWPAVARAAAFMERQMTPSGILVPCKDLWETFTDKSWTYTNASFVGGLEDAARMGQALGMQAETRSFARSAADLRRDILAKMVVAEGGWLGKGLKPGAAAPDPVIDASVVGAGWPYGLVPLDHPVMTATLARVETRLTVPGGGIRRYEGDGWYGGQGWPELQDWMAISRAARGERASALAHHATNTERAWTTGSLQIGEVFDANRRVFPSAFPLGWAMAKYVLASHALHGPAHPVLPARPGR
ncbi:MAG: hypothetical protein FJY99_11875 [Candidatus Sericytochromatia bacterium]|nr:hypothetical protein [Candidatus Tanganyikabacteria bacterium]